MKEIKNMSPFTKVTAAAFAALILISVIRPVLSGGSLPRFWPLVIGIVSSALLYFVPASPPGATGLMRIGFHVGLFAFFVAFPLLSPEEINPEILEETHWTLGWALTLSVLGFESGYWILNLLRKPKEIQPILLPNARQRNLLLGILALGVAAWFFSVWSHSSDLNVPITTVLLTMRGRVEGTTDDLTKPGYLSLIMASGIFLAAAAASLLLTRCRRSVKTDWFCWVTLIACAAIGFLNGSRAVFLYSFIPLAITVWRKLSTLRFMKSIRWPGALGAVAVLIVVWSAMSAMRGSDIRTYEGSLEDISLVAPAQGALDIYSGTAEVLETFPDRIPFLAGESIVPLVLGWVPRSIWPSKPYPFGLYMNLVNGETIQARAASLAVGLTGEGYGNFGLFGAFLWAFFLGIPCRQGDRLLQRLHPDDTLHLLLGGMAMVWVAMIVRGGVPEMFYMGLQIMALPLVLARLLLGRQKSVRKRVVFRRSPTDFGRQRELALLAAKGLIKHNKA